MLCVGGERVECKSRLFNFLCNELPRCVARGRTPVDSRYIDVEPEHVAMSEDVIAVASDSAVFVWFFGGEDDAAASTSAADGSRRGYAIVGSIEVFGVDQGWRVAVVKLCPLSIFCCFDRIGGGVLAKFLEEETNEAAMCVCLWV